MTALDQSVLELQRFLGELAQATDALERVGTHIEQSGRKLAEIGDQASADGGALNDGLEEMGTVVDAGQGDVRDALSDLVQAAADAQETIAQGQDTIEQAVSDLEDRVQSVLDDLDTAHSSLTDRGFQPLVGALDEAEREILTESQELEQAFGELKTALDGFESEAQAAGDGVETALEEATSDLAEGESALESAASDSVQGLESAAGLLEQACTDLEGEVDTIYDVLDSGVASEGQEWEQSVASDGQEAHAFVLEGTNDRVEQPAQTVREEVLPSFDQEHALVDLLLQGGVSLTAELEPLTSELRKCQAVVGQIDDLLNSLA